jgi:catechol 2,3-dioxygenase-like lactoylglutathione lyase family enzyme
MFSNIPVHATLPASDFDRAKRWYDEKLGLRPVDENPGVAWYEAGGTRFLLYASGFAGTNQATAATIVVAGFDAAVAILRSRGVVFEEYDVEDFTTVDGVIEMPDGRRAAWFKDSEGNILSIVSG